MQTTPAQEAPVETPEADKTAQHGHHGADCACGPSQYSVGSLIGVNFAFYTQHDMPAEVLENILSSLMPALEAWGLVAVAAKHKLVGTAKPKTAASEPEASNG